MPMQLRSATKKQQGEDVVHVGNGVYVRTTPSATGEGRHLRWDYDQEIIPSPTPTNQKGNQRAASFDSLFDGSISSISSSSSSDESSSSCDEPTTPSAPSPASDHHQQEQRHDLLEFVARNAARGGVPMTPHNTTALGPERVLHGSPIRHIAKGPYPRSVSSGSSGAMMSPIRPLQRTAARQWQVQSDGSLFDVASTSSSLHAPVPTAWAASLGIVVNTDAIYEREMQILMRKHLNVLAGVSAMQNTNEEEGLNYGSPFVKSDAEASQGPSTAQSSSRRLGPHGTELIDEETFRTPSGDISAYPNRWVTHQSNTFKSHPTETNLDVTME